MNTDIIKSDNFIYVRNPTLKYANANRFCQQRFGTDLASVHSDDEMYEITCLVANDVAYIGLDDKGNRGVEGTFTWIDGTSLDYTKWAPGEPNQHGGTNEDCTVTWEDGEYWNDAPCSYEQQFVCARPRTFIYLFVYTYSIFSTFWMFILINLSLFKLHTFLFFIINL